MKLSRRTLATFVFAALVAVGIPLLAQKFWFDRAPVSFNPPYPAANVAGDPIFAVYEGRTPCPDCPTSPMVKVMLVLYHERATAKPTTYWLGLVGLDGNNRTIYQGDWTERRGVAGYPDAVAYQLDSHGPATRSAYWRVNDDILLLLDQGMAPKVGNAAWGYMLSRYSTPYGPRTYERRAAL